MRSMRADVESLKLQVAHPSPRPRPHVEACMRQGTSTTRWPVGRSSPPVVSTAAQGGTRTHAHTCVHMHMHMPPPPRLGACEQISKLDAKLSVVSAGDSEAIRLHALRESVKGEVQELEVLITGKEQLEESMALLNK